MTLEEFKAQWDAAHQEKEPDWEVGEWREYHISTIDGSYDLLKKCKSYWNPAGNVAIKNNPLEKKGFTRSKPLFERYFVVNKDGERYLCECNRPKGSEKDDEGVPGTILYAVGNLSFKQIECLVDDNSYTNWHKYNQRPKNSIPKERVVPHFLWSIAYDGQCIFALMAEKPKMTYNEIVNVIVNEGGSVDAAGFIHKK